MSEPRPPGYGGLILTSILMAAVGWLGLWLVINYTLPTIGPRWLFFFLLTVAVAGTGMPIILLLHRRFGAANPAPAGVLLRQGLWTGLLAALCAWLQINRSLTLGLGILVAASLFAFEWLLRLFERSSRRSMR
jgi:Flp pilus assembly protein protease CpaA